MTHDVVVLGAGPGGYDTAVECASLGLKTALVERDLLGGTCLNRGCIPTKMLLGATSAVEELAAQSKVKVASGSVDIDYPALATRSERIIAATRKAMAQRLKGLGVDLVAGTGRLAGAKTLTVDTEDGAVELPFENLVVATGSTPSSFPGIAPDGQAVVDSTGFLALEKMPESLIVVGAGYIGLEMAQVAHRLGATIHVVDLLERVASYEDPEVSKALASIYKRWKWDVRLGVRVRSVSTVDGKAVLTLEKADGTSDEIAAETALLAMGRRPVSRELGLEESGAVLEGPGWIKTDEHLLAAPGVYAVGDVNGRFMLAHCASHQARYVARRIAGKTDAPYASGPVPSVLYGAPEAMRVGRMAAELVAEGLAPQVSAAPLAANPIAQSHAATHGFVKVVWLDGRVVGVTAVGHEASRFATAAAMIVAEGWTSEDAHKVIFAHPTLDETLLHALEAERKDV